MMHILKVWCKNLQLKALVGVTYGKLQTVNNFPCPLAFSPKFIELLNSVIGTKYSSLDGFLCTVFANIGMPLDRYKFNKF